MNACSQKAELPVAIKKPYEMIEHGHTRIDDYYWMRLTDEQKSKKPYDDHTQQVIDYINLEMSLIHISEPTTRTPIA